MDNIMGIEELEPVAPVPEKSVVNNNVTHVKRLALLLSCSLLLVFFVSGFCRIDFFNPDLLT